MNIEQLSSKDLNAAVIVVDVQNDFCPGGKLAVAEGDQIVPSINKITYLAGRCLYSVVFSRDWHPKKTTHFDKWPVHCVQGSYGAGFHPRLDINYRDDEIISKGMGEDEDSYSAFDGYTDYGLSLEEFLHEYENERIYICGLATEYCVKATALDGIKRGFETILIEDACRAVNPEDRKNAIKEMEKSGVKISNLETIIKSLLWTDLYKLTMGQAVFSSYDKVSARYNFINRGKTPFPSGFDEKLKGQIVGMADIKLSDDELDFLQKRCLYLKPDFLDWFRNYQFDPDEVKIRQNDGNLDIKIEGPWLRTIYWEVPLMTTISELYFKETNQKADDQYIQRAFEKGGLMKEAGAKLIDFGTRRAFSTKVHEEVLSALIKSAGLNEQDGILVGTSNVALAKKFGIHPIGTYAHEWVMGHAAIFGNKLANQKAMEVWAKEYLGLGGGTAYPQLGTALMDTYTTEAFLKDLTPELVNYYTFFRQDSGDPIEKGIKLVNRLRELGFDPMTKGGIFTDGLNIPKAIDINEYFKNLTQRVFGIGTDISNDVGVTPLNFVIKLFGIRNEDLWIPVAKLSDDRGKQSGGPEAIKQVKLDLGLGS